MKQTMGCTGHKKTKVIIIALQLLVREYLISSTGLYPETEIKMAMPKAIQLFFCIDLD